MSHLDEGPKQTDLPPGNQHSWAARWGATVGWMSVIFVASAWPGQGPPPVQGLDKLLHLTAYAILTVLLFRCWLITAASSRTAISVGRTSIIVIGYGLLLELYQIRVPGRDFQWFDILANCGGVVIASAVLLYFYSKRSTDEVISHFE